MCGIVAYIGPRQAAPILLEGLSRLEYRGYDSAGIAVRDGQNDPVVIKSVGRLRILQEKTNNGQSVAGQCGIGHTRWATHGEPSEVNAHPHISGEDKNVTGVHNGIIENYQELREKLIRHGYHFYSGTDTEVVIKTIDYYYRKYEAGPIDALNKTMLRVRGSFALAVMFRDYPGQIYCMRKDSPLVIGCGQGETLAASDVPALLSYTRDVYYMDNLEIACLTADGAVFYNLDGDTVDKKMTHITWDADAAEKGGYEHFMLKEIHEQPRAIQDTLDCYVHDGAVCLEETGLTEEQIASFRQIHIVACGSAYHVGVASQYVLEDLARIPVRVELASEFRYRTLLLDKKDLVIIVSQSGETADSLAALRVAKENGVPTLAVVNVMGSTIAREADYVMYTKAGPEIAVATTKAYSAQLVALDLIAIAFGQRRGQLEPERVTALLRELMTLPVKISRLLEDKERIQWFANKVFNAKDVFYIGRGLDYAVCMEGSLKLKEISYVHSEAYAAGELKHGTISLIEKGTLVIGVLTQKALLEKTMSNMVEVRSRGAYLVGLTVYGNYELEDQTDFTVYIPRVDEHFTASLAVVPLQLLGYYISVARGLDVDKPRNLAKSVTVE